MSLDIKKCIRSAHVEMPVAHGLVGVFEGLVRMSRCGDAGKNVLSDFLGHTRGTFIQTEFLRFMVNRKGLFFDFLEAIQP